ncbi:MAG: protein kinase domain-containing protein [Gemmatimonadaceae bacterium]
MRPPATRHGPSPPPAPGSRDPAVERWAALEALFQRALSRPPDARRAYLDASCPDAGTRAEVEALLAAHEGRGALDRLADEVMTPLLARRERALEPVATPPMHSRYRILERLGGGGMGVVYRARDERLGRDVALKFLPPHLSADHAAKKRFLVEARAAAALEHPNICTVHEIGETDDGQLYIVMACYDGETLDRLIARGPLAVDEALRVAGDIARALVKAHERGIVHRDIKPANVMVTVDGVVKLLDFGIAKLADVTITQTAGAVGTVAYMSPEQAFGELVDQRTDIWSLGVVLYEMLTGVRPFRGPGEHAVLVATLAVDPEPVARLRADVPAGLDGVIRGALARRPSERFASAAELLAAIAACTPSGAGATVAGGAGDREGRPRDTALARGGERRHVTVVSCAIAGYGALVERLSADEAERVTARLRAAAAEVATHHGGIVNHFSGDGFVMLFGVPTAHEDDAARGVRAALAMRERLADVAATLDARLAAGLRLRSGIHVGPVVALRLREGDRRFRVTGAPADIADRLAAAAEPDVILLSPESRRLVAPIVHTVEARPMTLSAGGAAILPHRVLGASEVRSRLEGAARSWLTPFVGREHESATLAGHLAAAREGTGRLTVLVGEAGAGKSRLLHELRAAATDSGMRVLAGRCDAYGVATPFLPFVEAARQALSLPPGGEARERHDAVVAAALAIDGSLAGFIPLYLALFAIPSETHPVPAQLRGELFQAAMLEAVAALFTLGARSTPTLLLLEDWHWADEASRAALRQLTEIVPAFPLLLVVTSRPEGAADWGSADHQTLINLPPLDVPTTAAMARAVLGVERVEPELLARLHERTGGNPFFLEEVCAALHEDGALVVRDGEAMAADASGALHVPETVQGVLRTRIDRLSEEARDALRVASVIGREFTRGVLEDATEPGSGLARALERLKASGLVQQVGVVPEPAFRFKHALTQEVAYDSLLEHQRRTLHAVVGRAMERRYAARLDEHVERLAHHFGRAEAWEDAVRYGLQAADRATALSQNADALNTLERVEEWLLRLPEDTARRDLRADVLLRQERLCEALGFRDRQLALVEALIALLAPHGPSVRLAQAYLRQGDAFTLRRQFEAAERALETALRIAGEQDDAPGERNALRSIALLRSHEGRREEALVNIERVLALGRAAGDTRAEAGDLATLANILRAMGEPGQALAVLQTALERTVAADNPVRYGALLNVIGNVYRDLGDNEAALAYFRRVASEGVEQRHPVYASFTLPAIAHIQLHQGHVEEALATYRQAVEMNRRAHYADGSAHACRSLGEALVGLERDEEALPHLRDAAALFAQLDDRANEALMWRRVAAANERLGRPGDGHAAWERVRELRRAIADLAGEVEAVEGMARTERMLPVAAGAVIARYEEALALAARLTDGKRELAVRNALGILHWRRGAYDDALHHYEAALRICRETADRVHEGLILGSIGATLHRLRRWDEARTVLGDAVRVTLEAGERQLRAHALSALGEVCLASGRLDEAGDAVEAALALRRELDDRRGEGWMLERLGRVRAAEGAAEAALHAADAGSEIAREIGDAALLAAVERLRAPVAPIHIPHP